ncbi:18325_t:CDS:2, partial [Racocetra fulgida]
HDTNIIEIALQEIANERERNTTQYDKLEFQILKFQVISDEEQELQIMDIIVDMIDIDETDNETDVV